MRTVDLASAEFLTPALPAGVKAIVGKSQQRTAESTDLTIGRRPPPEVSSSVTKPKQ
jgi:hypothetical protein